MNRQTRSTCLTVSRLTPEAQLTLDGSGRIARDVPWPVYEELITHRCARRGGVVTPFGQRVGAAVRGELGSPPDWHDLGGAAS